VADLDALLERRRDPEQAPAILAALAALAPGDELAARTLLQALLPGLLRLAVAHASTGGVDTICDMVALAWVRIRTYPASRTAPVAGNVLWDVRKGYNRFLEASGGVEMAVDPRNVVHLCDTRPEVLQRTGVVEDEALARVSVRELLRAHRPVVGSRGLNAVVRTHVQGWSTAEVAAQENTTPENIRQRRCRALHQLRQLPHAG
jgi:DNA-directed RNA polymerase specialized sigma24 family protein